MDFAIVLRQRRTVNRSVVAETYPSCETPEERELLSVSPIDVVGHLPPAEYNTYISNAVTFEGDVFNDRGNEPFVAVNPVNPNQIVVSSFAYGAYVFTFTGDTRSSLWYSQDGGATWGIRFPIPTQPVPTEGVPDDQTFAYDSNGVLHGAFLTYGLTRTGPSLNIFHGTTTDPNMDGVEGRPASVWQWNTNHVNLPNPTQDKADQSAGLSLLITALDPVRAGGTSPACPRTRPQLSNGTSIPRFRGTARLVPSGLHAGAGANAARLGLIVRRQVPQSGWKTLR